MGGTRVAGSARTKWHGGKLLPDLFLRVSLQMRVAAPKCVVVEDSSYGAQAAVVAGMVVPGYAGWTERMPPAEAGVHVFDDMRDLPDLLGRRTI